MATNKARLRNLEISMGGLQDILRHTEAGMFDKLQQIETTIQQLMEALVLN